MLSSSDLPPAGLAQPVDAEDREAEGGQDHQELAERLVPQREQRLVDAARLRCLVGDGRVDHEYAGQSEDQAAGDGPDHAEHFDDTARPGAHLRRLQVLRKRAAGALADQDQADDDDNQADDPDQPPALGMPHDRGRDVLLLAGLTVLRAGDDRERQVGEARVDHRPGQRDQPGARAVLLTGHAEGGFAEPPQGVGGEADAEQPQRDQPVGLAREQLQGALLVGFLRAVAERDQHRDPADQQVDDAARGQAGAGQDVRRWAARGPPGAAGGAGGRYGVHTRLYLESASGNAAARAGWRLTPTGAGSSQPGT